MSWDVHALDLLETGAPTPLVEFPVAAPGVRLLLKDESAHPTGSLRHRHARALLRRAVLDGLVTEGTTVVEATGGNAAVAQAWFARRLGLPYIVVMPGARGEERARPVEELGGECRFVTPPLAIYDAARQIEGHFLDQFGRAVEHDLADELFAQVRPDWVVVGAGTGATSATLGRRAQALVASPGAGPERLPTLAGPEPGSVDRTRVAVADPENSAYFPGWTLDVSDYATGMPSRIEGIGRPRVEPGFRPDLVDLVIPVPDAASVAAARRVREVTGLPVGGSSGTALWAALELVERMRAKGRHGTVVSVIGDAHPRHLATYHDDAWATAKGLDVRAHERELLRRTS
ncbi:PLP-dependent cysteine synthase family protein [Nonomuraea cavernae]|uniref:Cysteine synthase n=1 Tax=Nonomuraea cavernae TaxID=2045107 RepID=A0A918DN77_9ACTN|nr:pyridoxal-phosphate dependent enzyme [Nonomuraea cavernae]MCA2188646.1 pyridoxal-phosphate dependent enzyme [Nonomuraea cavernae]GGO74415.1 cysteine synthase [Nonomuraea cavernae]